MEKVRDALLCIQAELKAPKGNYNAFGKYKYRSCEDILEAVKPLLNKYGCILTLTDDIVMVGSRIYVKATATLRLDATTIETSAFAREEDEKKGMDASQVTGAASSYARKYALNGLFAIDDAKDSDYTNTHGKEAKAEPAPTPTPTLGTEDAKKLTEFALRVQSAASMDDIKAIVEEAKAYPAITAQVRKIANDHYAELKKLNKI